MRTDSTYDFTLHLSDDVVALMEKRFILVSEVEHVIDHAQKSKERFFNPQTSEYLAHLRVQNVTYWVKYEEKNSDIFIKDAYSHRMEVMEN